MKIRKVLLTGVCAVMVVAAWSWDAQAQGGEYDLIRDNPHAEDMYFGWMEAAITPPHTAVGLSLGDNQLSVRCVSLGRMVQHEPGHGYCGLHVGRPGYPSVGIGLSMSRDIRPFPDSAMAIDLTFGCAGVVALFEYGDYRREYHVFFMLRLDRIWNPINRR